MNMVMRPALRASFPRVVDVKVDSSWYQGSTFRWNGLLSLAEGVKYRSQRRQPLCPLQPQRRYHEVLRPGFRFTPPPPSPKNDSPENTASTAAPLPVSNRSANSPPRLVSQPPKTGTTIQVDQGLLPHHPVPGPGRRDVRAAHLHQGPQLHQAPQVRDGQGGERRRCRGRYMVGARGCLEVGVC